MLSWFLGDILVQEIPNLHDPMYIQYCAMQVKSVSAIKPLVTAEDSTKPYCVAVISRHV